MNGKAQVAGTAGARALRWEDAWSVLRTSGSSEAECRELEGVHREVTETGLVRRSQLL